MALEGKVAIVTGGAQGIGRATAWAFAAAGARVYAADIDEEAGAELPEGIEFVRADVAEEGDVKNLVERVVAVEGRVDVVINNAGIGDRSSLQVRPLETWDRILAVNLRGPYLLVRYAEPHMPPGGAVVNIASTRALMSEADTEPYSASKGGLRALTHSLAVSLAEKGIRVNCISPGWIDVSNWKKASVRRPEALSPEDHRQHLVGRVGRPEDVAEACLFLADGDRAGFITGQNLVVDGGMTVKMIYADT